MKVRQTRFLALQTAEDLIREEILNGVKHKVVPLVALVEGVLQGITSDGPELVTAKEFSDKVQGWNGRPVTMGHPIRNNRPVSAGDPSIWENEAIGQVFNAHTTGDRLKMEAWINLERVEAVGDEALAMMERIEKGEEVEISTGYLADVKQGEGTFNGEPYIGIQENIVPDHLAILEKGSVGACSWKDGCGLPRVNTEKKDEKKTKFGEFFDKFTGFFKLSANGELSDRDKRQRLQAALDSKFPDEFAFLSVVFDKNLVYEKGFGQLFQVDYSINTDGSVTLGDAATEVVAETSFVPLAVNEEEDGVDKKELVEKLIGNEATEWKEEDREVLEGIEIAVLEKMVPVANTLEVKPAETIEETLEDDDKQTPEQEDRQGKVNAAKTPQEFISQAPLEMREVLNSSLKMHTAKKAKLVESLVANERCSYTKEQLEAKDMDELEILADMAQVSLNEDYSGRALTHNEDEPEGKFAPKPPSLNERLQKVS